MKARDGTETALTTAFRAFNDGQEGIIRLREDAIGYLPFRLAQRRALTAYSARRRRSRDKYQVRDIPRREMGARVNRP